MRNLVLYDLTRHYLHEGLRDAKDVLLINDILYVVLGTWVHRTVKSNSDLCRIALNPCITDLYYMVLEQKLCFGTGTSLEYYCPISNNTIVIESPQEFCAAVWSPSQEMLVIMSNNDEVFVYSVDSFHELFKCLGSCHISDPITITSTNIGWGSSQTQFRGSDGKLPDKVYKKTMREVPREAPRIVWRGDGEYFAINYWTAGKRMFKVFGLPCVPVHASDDTPGIQAPISWNHIEGMIACSVHSDMRKISIFEKNGLLTQSFQLHEQNMEVKDLKWDPTGEILAVHQSYGPESFNVLSCLSLYTISNCHWYLKQRLDFSSWNRLHSFSWAERSDKIFELIVATSRDLVVYQFIYKVSRSPNCDTHGTCMVVDGRTILCYNLTDGLFPPPGANQEMLFENPVSHVMFNSTGHEVIIIDCQYRAYLLGFEKKNFFIKHDFTLSISGCLRYPHNMHHFYWKANENLFGIDMSDDTNHIDILYKYDNEFSRSVKSEIAPRINYIEYYDNFRLMLCAGGEIYLDDVLLFTRFSSSSILHLEPYTCENKLLLFSLNLASQFYIDDKCVAEGVTSFLIHVHYLYVTTEDRLYCLRLKLKDIEGARTLGLFESCYSREMEKDGILISGFPNKIAVIMQMPRGNTEVSSSRNVAIDRLDAFLDEGMWGEACELFRMEKLNSNLLVDLNPDRFFRLLPQFLTHAYSMNIIIGFVLDLVDENVLETKYKIRSHVSSRSIDNKKKSVCQAIVSCVIDTDAAAFIKVIMVATVNADGIDGAVEYLKETHSNNPQENVSTVLSGLECLKLYFSYEVICASALSTYDTDFALLVYLNSSMDPKVYKPLIEEFEACENESVKRFKINDHLNLYRDAMHYLVRDLTSKYISGGDYNANDLDLLIEYARKHILLLELYEVCTVTGIFFREVSVAYASYLTSQKVHRKAAIVYNCAQFYPEALEQYKLCNRWQEALTVLEEMNVTEVKKLMHISEIAKALENCDNYKDASFLYEVYLKDCELAITILLKGKLFVEAIRIAHRFGRADLLETIIEPAFKEFTENVFKKLNSSHADFNKYKSRLEIVRQKKIELILASEENPGEQGDSDNADIESSASVSSRASRSTRSFRSRSSSSTRSRRREDMKKQNTRQGGYYEDIALMRTLHQLITDIFAMGLEVEDICHLFLLLKIPRTSKNLQDLFVNVRKDMIQSLPEIWPENLNSFGAGSSPELQALRQNLEFLELTYRSPPEVSRKPWQEIF